MSYPEKFQGIAVVEGKDWKDPQKIDFNPKVLNDTDIDIKIEACGVCGSDIHCASGHWGSKVKPLVVGHEIIGRVVRMGPKCVNDYKIGDRVGMGAQASSCFKCKRCLNDNEAYCDHWVGTYAHTYPDGYISQGGYANYVRVPEFFTVPIPENIPIELAAPLMCGGLTVFSPLVRNGCGPGKKVGIVGIGGIGHMGVLLAKALGAEVYAISRGYSKKEDSFKLGADHFIATKEEPDWVEKYFDTFDLIVICAGSLTDIDFSTLPRVMNVGGAIVSISIPDKDQLLTLKPFGLSGVSISNSHLGSMNELKQLVKLVSEKDVKIWVETIPISEAGVKEAFSRLEEGDVRYRFTLVDYDKEFS